MNFNGRSPNDLIVQGGVSRDLWGYYHLSRDGVLPTDVPVRSSWGPTFSAGLYRRIAPLLAGELSVFARFGELDVGGIRVDGRSFGVTLTDHLDF